MKKFISFLTISCFLAANFAYASDKELDKETYNVKLISYENKLDTIKEVKRLTGIGLKDSKELVESAPVMIPGRKSKQKAEDIKAALERLGCEVKVVSSTKVLDNLSKLKEKFKKEKRENPREKEKKAQAIKRAMKKKRRGHEKSRSDSEQSVTTKMSAGDSSKVSENMPEQKTWYSVVYLGSSLAVEEVEEILIQINPEAAKDAYLISHDPPQTIEMSLERDKADKLAEKFQKKGLDVLVVPNSKRPHISKRKKEYLEARKKGAKAKVRRLRENANRVFDTEEDKLIKLKDITFFEAGKGFPGPLVSPPFMSKRNYNDEFAREDARHIYVQFELKNPYDKKTEGMMVNYRVKALLYGPDGELWSDQTDKVSIGSHEVKRSKYFMFGWPTPGKWPAGKYRIEAIVDGKEEGAVEFSIVDSAKDMPQRVPELYKIRFFEAGDLAPHEKDREYKEKFPRSKSRRIYTEVKLRNLNYGGKEGTCNLERIYYKPDGQELCRGEKKIILDPDKSVITDIWGWGSDDPGVWWTGNYKVKVLLNGQEVAEKEGFKVYNELVKGRKAKIKFTEMKFFEGPKKVEGSKTYSDTFKASNARYIYVQCFYKNLSYRDKTGKYYINIVIKNAEGEQISTMKHTLEVPAKWKTVHFFKGWGKSDPGFWKPGEYTVEVSGKRAGKGTGKFLVK